MTAVTVTLKTTVRDATLMISALREAAVLAHDRAKSGPPAERVKLRVAQPAPVRVGRHAGGGIEVTAYPAPVGKWWLAYDNGEVWPCEVLGPMIVGHWRVKPVRSRTGRRGRARRA